MCNLQLKIVDSDSTLIVEESNFKTVKVQFDKSDFQFFRPKIDGTISFYNNLFNHIIDSTKCCNSLPMRIERANTTLIDFLVEPSGFDVDFKINKLQSQSNKTLDFWRSIMFIWNEKINVLATPRTQRVLHKYINDDNDYIEVVNDKFYKLSEFIFIVVSETFKKAGLDAIIPSSSTNLSSFFSENTLPWGGENFLKNACVAQMSDFVRPLSDPATGIEEISGKINESVSVDLKTLLQTLEIFDIYPLIGPDNKFRLEHISYFQYGNSYDKNKVGVNLFMPEFLEYVKNFDYSYTPDNSNIFGKYSLSITNNESIIADEAADKYLLTDVEIALEKNWFKSRDYFAKITATFDTECALRDEKNELQENGLSFDMFTTHYYGASVNCASNNINSWILLDCTEKDSSNIRSINVDTIGIINGRLTAEYIFKTFHLYNKPTSFFKIDENIYQSKSLIKKHKLREFKLPSNYLNSITSGINKLPDGREFVIDSFYLNLQDNFLYVTAYTDIICDSDITVGRNGCPIKDLLISTYQLPYYYIDPGTGLYTYVMKNYSYYTNGNCGFYVKIE
jgi:hypothetical protein